MRRLLLLLAATLLVVAACSSDDSGDSSSTTAAGGDTTATTAGSDTGSTVDLSDLPSFDTVAEIGEALACDLEYDGIVDADREFSTCVLDQGEQATIYVFSDPASVGDIVTAGAPALVYGANWTIEVDTPEVAEAVADATDGAVAPPS